jgi:hypothetical protein
VRSWWLYTVHRERITAAVRSKLVKDTWWWISILDDWSAGSVTGKEYPIFSASELLADQQRIYFVQSDASGDDGFGYYHGTISERDPRYYSQEWDSQCEFRSSHNGELQALNSFLVREEVENRVLVWVSDSLSAVWSVNKGRCHADVSMETLEEILEACDRRHLQLLAIWVPREHNEMADYLSHLSRDLLRSSVEGSLGEIPRDGSAREARSSDRK